MIHYKKWKQTDDLLLPTELQWYRYKNNELGEPKGTPRLITDARLSHQPKPASFYAIPEGASVDTAHASSKTMKN